MPQNQQDFQNASFVPFSHYVEKARRAPRHDRTLFGRRRVDFADAIIVSEVPMKDVPEFADTVPMLDDGEPMTLPEVSDAPVNIVVTADMISAAEVIAIKIARARNFIAARAYAECVHAGYFPPACQSCGR